MTDDWHRHIGKLDDPSPEALSTLLSCSGPWHAILHTGLYFKVNRTIRTGLILPCAQAAASVAAAPSVTPAPTDDPVQCTSSNQSLASRRPRRTRSLSTREAVEHVSPSFRKWRAQKKQSTSRKDKSDGMADEGALLLHGMRKALPHVIEKGQIMALESILSMALAPDNIPFLSQIAPLFQQSIQVRGFIEEVQ